MIHLKTYKLFENKFFTISDERRKKLIDYINSSLDGTDFNFSSWIYEHIIRGKQENTELNDFIQKVSPIWKKTLDEYLSKYQSGVMEIRQDKQNVWIQPTYNSSLQKKEVKGGKEITKNFYVTFEKSEANLKKWFNGLASLISDFYEACTEGELKNSAISFKFGYDAKHFIEDNDHLKFYWYKDEDKSKVLEIYNNWLKKTGIQTEKRAYDFGIDTKKGSDINSFGLIVANKVNDQFQKLKSQYGKKFTAEQYVDYIIDMLNKTKFKI